MTAALAYIAASVFALLVLYRCYRHAPEQLECWQCRAVTYRPVTGGTRWTQYRGRWYCGRCWGQILQTAGFAAR